MKNKIGIVLILILFCIAVYLGIKIIRVNNIPVMDFFKFHNEEVSAVELVDEIEEPEPVENDDGTIKQAMFEEDFYDLEKVAIEKYTVLDQMSDDIKKEELISEKEFDLNLDEEPETVSFYETNYKVVLKVNDVVIDKLPKSELTVYIVDLDKEDEKVEILIRPNGWYEEKMENTKIYDVSIANKRVRSQKSEILNREYYYTNQAGTLFACVNSNASNGASILDHLNPKLSLEYFEFKNGTVRKYDYNIKNLVNNEFTASNFWFTNDYKKLERFTRDLKYDQNNLEGMCQKYNIQFLDKEYKFKITEIKKIGTDVILKTESLKDGTVEYLIDYGF